MNENKKNKNTKALYFKHFQKTLTSPFKICVLEDSGLHTLIAIRTFTKKVFL